MIKKIFIATSSFGLNHQIKSQAKRKKYEIILNPLKRKLRSDEIIKYGNDASIIIAGTEEYNSQVLKKLNKLEVIFRLGSGIDNIDTDYTKKLGIKVYKSKLTPHVPVAELVVSNIINILRKINKHHNDMKNLVWKKNMGYTLKGKTLGIIGYGKIGKYLKKILNNFGVKIIFYDKKNFFSKKQVNLNYLLKNSDIISIHLDLNVSSKNIINKSKINMFKKNAIIVNTSRSEVIDYKSLYNSLKNKKILGAILDVFPVEPYFGKLIKLKNVLITPHIGSYAYETRKQMEKESLSRVMKI